ncbi:MAG: putative lipid II flippase FtsW [Candidatus Omnitrophica bacterium]|nr:putative lipid II flippase FtsW [Candidatus Omnitrophota bacterium]MBI2174823.1 putative lipid II flippase FtsW [Candidatus Omnitrophota bacterium]MBI3010266.1 putative lipid II flippase FtsW [Candidatus Omnitrophota bacterium]
MNPRRLRQMLLVVILTLLSLGIVAVYSASAFISEATYGGSARFLFHHLIAVACGLLLAVVCLGVPFSNWRRWARWLLLASIVMLLLVVLFGQEVSGAKRWFRIGRLSLQPSEFAQLSLVVYLSDVLARRSEHLQDFWKGLLPPLLVTGTIAGLVLLQPDLGTTIAIGAVAFLLFLVAKARPRHLLIVASIAIIAVVFLIAGEEYRRRRILTFLNPWADPQGSGYQILQSYVSLASGGVAGLGVGSSLQKLFFLPSAHTDFIFAIIGEELGLLGTTAVIILFALFITCGLRIAVASSDLFSKYLVCGLVGMIGFEAMVNIAVVTGMLPTKGLPLPLLSYGGTSMVMNLVACALIFQASRHGERIYSKSAVGR